MEVLSPASEVEVLSYSGEVQMSHPQSLTNMKWLELTDTVGSLQTKLLSFGSSCHQNSHRKFTWDNYNKHTKLWFTETSSVTGNKQLVSRHETIWNGSWVTSQGLALKWMRLWKYKAIRKMPIGKTGEGWFCQCIRVHFLTSASRPRLLLC